MILIQIAGHLGADPEVRHSPSGQKITTLRVATNIKRQGKEETVWWRVTIFGDHLDKILSFMKKGSALITIGKMSGAPQVYTDKNGQQQVQLEIIAQMIEFPFRTGERQGGEQSGQPYGNQQPSYPPSQAYGNENRAAPARHAPEPSFAAPTYSSAPNGFGNSNPSYGAAPSHHDDSDEDHVPF